MERNLPKLLLTSPVFHDMISNQKILPKWKEKIEKYWIKLHKVADVMVMNKRFPSAKEISEISEKEQVDFIGCHLSHQISKQTTQIS
ncbi:MAG: hypothetical protein ACTSVL_01450, partial [Promethearchaeota archaeon]